LLLSVIFCLLSCRERTNQFDICDDDFVSPPPPPIGLAWVTQGYYDPNTGYLVGVQIEVDFVEEFERTLSITHIFYQDISERLHEDFAIKNGTTSYTIDIIYASGHFPIGSYCLKIYFAEIAIGACPFSVVAKDNHLVIEGVSEYNSLTNSSGDCRLFVSF